MGAVTFHLLCCHACQKWQFGGLSGDARESRVEVVEEGFPHISARGYIIISKVKIFNIKTKGVITTSSTE